MSDKPFKTYTELVEKLRDEKHLSVPDEEEVINLLKKHSYYSLVSGYKSLFKDKDGYYKEGTTIKDIEALFEFDNRLRDIFFHSIQIVEKHIKSLLSYSFVEKYGDLRKAYIDPENYDYVCSTKEKTDAKYLEVERLTEVLKNITTPPFEHKYIEHQFIKHNNIPLWATIKAVTMGTTSKMYSLCTKSVQASVSREFPAITENQLAGMLDYLTRVRNVCAHNERLYNYKASSKRAIPAMPIHSFLGIRKEKSYYVNGQTDLFAAMICLKYLLSAAEYKVMADDVKTELETLCRKTKKIPKNKIISCMGFPPNWYETINVELTPVYSKGSLSLL